MTGDVGAINRFFLQVVNFIKFKVCEKIINAINNLERFNL